MSSLFSQRLGRHIRLLLRYLRLVFNDHFVIALMFFVGGLGLAYSNWLKTLSGDTSWLRWLIFAVLLLGLQFGRLATLLEPADPVFLLPREHDLHAYLQRARNYSLVMASLIQIAIVALLVPLILVVTNVSTWQLLWFVLIQLLLKDGWLTSRFTELYQSTHSVTGSKFLFEWLLPAVVLGISSWGLPFIGVALAVVFALGLRFWHARTWNQRVLAWRDDIAGEANRMLGIYRFFNLFTDVPMVHGTVKRRAFLDGLFRWIRPTQNNTFTYLFARGMLRGTEFSGLFLRLTVIGMILIYFLPSGWLMWALNALFIYLIGFQLLPFFKQYDNIVFTHLYPVAKKIKLIDFQKLLAILLTTTAVLFLVAAIFSKAALATLGILIAIDLVEIYLLVVWYARLRLA